MAAGDIKLHLSAELQISGARGLDDPALDRATLDQSKKNSRRRWVEA